MTSHWARSWGSRRPAMIFSGPVDGGWDRSSSSAFPRGSGSRSWWCETNGRSGGTEARLTSIPWSSITSSSSTFPRCSISSTSHGSRPTGRPARGTVGRCPLESGLAGTTDFRNDLASRSPRDSVGSTTPYGPTATPKGNCSSPWSSGSPTPRCSILNDTAAGPPPLFSAHSMIDIVLVEHRSATRIHTKKAENR